MANSQLFPQHLHRCEPVLCPLPPPVSPCLPTFPALTNPHSCPAPILRGGPLIACRHVLPCPALVQSSIRPLPPIVQAGPSTGGGSGTHHLSPPTPGARHRTGPCTTRSLNPYTRPARQVSSRLLFGSRNQNSEGLRLWPKATQELGLQSPDSIQQEALPFVGAGVCVCLCAGPAGPGVSHWLGPPSVCSLVSGGPGTKQALGEGLPSERLLPPATGSAFISLIYTSTGMPWAARLEDRVVIHQETRQSFQLPSPCTGRGKLMANSPAPGRAPRLAHGAGRALERPSGRPPRGPSTCCPEVAPGGRGRQPLIDPLLRVPNGALKVHKGRDAHSSPIGRPRPPPAARVGTAQCLPVTGARSPSPVAVLPTGAAPTPFCPIPARVSRTMPRGLLHRG